MPKLRENQIAIRAKTIPLSFNAYPSDVAWLDKQRGPDNRGIYLRDLFHAIVINWEYDMQKEERKDVQ